MNFLAHFYTTNSNIEAYKLLGVILPDVVKDFSKIHNHKIEEDFKTDVLEIHQMLEGIKLHLKGDNAFHNHSIFLELEAKAKKVLKAETNITVKRKFIIAHVLVELMLDQFIINNYTKTIDLFYNRLENIDLNRANLFFEALNTKEEVSHFKRNFSNFIEIKFLYHLKENEGVIFTLNKVFGTIFDYNFIAQTDLWNEIIEQLKESLSEKAPSLLDELKTKLYE